MSKCFLLSQVARRSLHRPAVVLRLSRLQVLDGVMVTLEERTRAELLCTEVQVRVMALPLCITWLVRALSS